MVSLALYTDSGHFAIQEGTNQLAYAPRGWQSWWLTSDYIWVCASAPFTGGFFARISRGRSIRQFIFGLFILPSIIIIFFMGSLSSAVCHVQLTGQTDVYAAFLQDKGSILYTTFQFYPLGKILSWLALICCALLGITTFDAATYFLSVQISSGKVNPSPLIKLGVGIMLGAVALTFLAIGDFFGLRGLGCLAGVPVLLCTPLFFVSLVKMCIKIDRGEM